MLRKTIFICSLLLLFSQGLRAESFLVSNEAQLKAAISPETPGGASLESGSRMEIGGDYLVVTGFMFVNGSNSNHAVRFYSGRDSGYGRTIKVERFFNVRGNPDIVV